MCTLMPMLFSIWILLKSAFYRICSTLYSGKVWFFLLPFITLVGIKNGSWKMFCRCHKSTVSNSIRINFSLMILFHIIIVICTNSIIFPSSYPWFALHTPPTHQLLIFCHISTYRINSEVVEKLSLGWFWSWQLAITFPNFFILMKYLQGEKNHKMTFAPQLKNRQKNIEFKIVNQEEGYYRLTGLFLSDIYIIYQFFKKFNTLLPYVDVIIYYY